MPWPSPVQPVALRSARDLPPEPAPEQILDTYQGCRDGLISTNTSRGARKADLVDQARAELRLHALHAKLGGVIRELEETGDVMVGLIDESERQSGFWLVEMFRRLVHQAKRWRAVKDRAATLAAEAVAEVGAADQLGGNA